MGLGCRIWFEGLETEQEVGRDSVGSVSLQGLLAAGSFRLLHTGFRMFEDCGPLTLRCLTWLQEGIHLKLPDVNAYGFLCQHFWNGSR